MCGIVGGWLVDPEGARLEAGVDAIAHRGPDGQGIFVAPEAGLGMGHRRLAIIDLSPTGAQPMASDDGRHVLVFNGEIYNYRELRAELEAQGVRFDGSSDTEVLLRLLLARGDDALAALNGIFAFALYDRDADELLLARDAMGVKPLYLRESGEGLVFASELKALVALGGGAQDLDLVALERYLTFQWCPGEGTPLRDVRKLGPGEAVRARAGRVERRWRWYRSPAFTTRHRPSRSRDAVDGTIAHLRAAVHRQLVADVPVGAFLSGGVDSSAVVAFARELAPDLTCYTIDASGGATGVEGAADLPYARRVAAHLGVRLEVVEVRPEDLIGGLAAMVEQLDEPLADPAPLNLRHMCARARADGTKVLLSGTGGDDLFTGYRRHLAVRYEALWAWWPRPLRTALRGSLERFDHRRPLVRRLARLFADADLEGDERLASYFAWARRSDLQALYSPDFAAAVAGVRPAQPMLDVLAEAPAGLDPIQKMLALEQRFYLADHNLVYTDKMSMAEGVEVRVPFLDAELVDYVSHVPTRFKQRGRVGKWLLKEAMAPMLPADVLHRPKTGFEVPLRAWLRGPLRAEMRDLLAPERLARRGLFDPGAVERLIEANEEGTRDATFTLFSLMCIEMWCGRYLDGAAPGAA